VALAFGAEVMDGCALAPKARKSLKRRASRTSRPKGWRWPGRDVSEGTTQLGRDLGLFRCRWCGVLRHVAVADV
jgi:hypothetical protein